MELAGARFSLKLGLLLIHTFFIVQSSAEINVHERTTTRKQPPGLEIILEGKELTCGLTTYDLPGESSDNVDRTFSERSLEGDYDDSCMAEEREQSSFDLRVINGTLTKPGQFPFLASLRGCAGVILDEFHVLTAAHCLRGQCGYSSESSADDPTRVRNIVVGDHHKGSDEGFEQQHEIHLEKIAIHDDFDCDQKPMMFSYDIALLRTKTKMQFKLTKQGSGSVNKICLPTTREAPYKTGDMLTLAGWGMISASRDNQDLWHVELPLFELDSCRKILRYKAGNSRPPSVLAGNQICAGYADGHKAACYGDSGGPLMRRLEDGRWELVGLTSFGVPGCRGPIVFVRAAHFLDWIAANW